jgi:hypothetical protein
MKLDAAIDAATTTLLLLPNNSLHTAFIMLQCVLRSQL